MPNCIPETVKLCNCAGCHRELLGASNKIDGEFLKLYSTSNKSDRLPWVYGRINDRPYCRDCARVNEPAGGGARVVRKLIKEDGN